MESRTCRQQYFSLVLGIIVTSHFYIIHESWRRNVAMKKQLH